MSYKSFTVMAKPSSSVCNIDCTYCFYLEKESLYPNRKKKWRMDGKTLELYIYEQINSQSSNEIEFIWQGGEPTLLGIDFFKEALNIQEKFKGNKIISNSIQTNATLLNLDWVLFLKKNSFLVGVSIDGDRISNDKYRLTRKGNSTFDDALKGIELLRKYKVEFNTLTVVNEENVNRPLSVYNFLKRIGSKYMQFIPLVERKAEIPTVDGLVLIQPEYEGESNVTAWSVPSSKYGIFLNKIFDLWSRNDIGKVFIINFEQTMSQIIGRSGSCVFSETCGSNLAMESNGDVYSCDHYVYPENRLGNINESSLIDLVNLPVNISFGMNKLLNISNDCNDCDVRFVCHGGCPKHRFEESSDGVKNKNYFCESYKKHFSYVVPTMSLIIDGLRKGKSNRSIMNELKRL